MKTKRITVLLFITAISLLTIFLLVLLDDSALASEATGPRTSPLSDLSPGPVGSMVEGPEFLSELSGWTVQTENPETE